MIKKLILVILIGSALFVFYIFYQGLNSAQNISIQSNLIDQPAPNFSGFDLMDSQAIDSKTLFANSFTLLNVFASWCLSCRDEHGLLMKLKRDGLLQIVGLNYKDKKEDALVFLTELGNPYHFIVADRGEIGFDYGVYAVPESFLIDSEGVIRYKLVGVLTEEIINHKIMPLIQNR